MAAIILAPYATVSLGFRQSLYVQAAVVLAAVTVGLVAGFGEGVPRRSWVRSRAIRRGLALFTGAAVFGGLVGLARGNEPVRVAGQVLSMLLLPLGAVVAARWRGDGARRAFTVAVVGSVCFAALLHMGYWLFEAAHGRLAPRLIFPNAVSVIGPSLLAWALALAAAGSEDGRLRRLGRFALPTLALFMLGAGARSLWVVGALVPPAYVVALRGRRALWRWKTVAVVVGVSAGLLGTAWVARLWLEMPRESAVPPSAVVGLVRSAGSATDAGRKGPVEWSWTRAGAGRRLESDAFPVQEGVWYRLETCLVAVSDGHARVDLQWLDDAGLPLGSERMWPDAGLVGCSARFAVAPREAVRARLRLQALSRSGRYELQAPTVAHLGSGFVTVLALQVRSLEQRLVSLWGRGQPGSSESAAKSTVRFRTRETLRLLSLVQESSWATKAVGRGLGATFPLDLWGYDNRGHWIHYGEGHYIHDFYAFLLFKLGFLGGAAVLAALALWFSGLVGCLRREGEDRRFLAAATVLVATGALWSISSPVFLDFRLAPLWGMVLVLALSERRNEAAGRDLQ